MHFLNDEEMNQLLGAEEAAFPSPVPTQVVSSDEYLPSPQTPQQKEVEARLIDMADSIASNQGLSRRRFFQSASGMAACFVAMNEVYGLLFDATPAEALRQAQVNMLRNGSESGMACQASLKHPYFWAPFILIGNWQ